MFLYVLFLLTLILVHVKNDECFMTAEAGGDSIKIYSYDTKSDCENHRNCNTKILYGEGCNDFTVLEERTIENVVCLSSGSSVEIHSKCSDCETCSNVETYGECIGDSSGGKMYSRVEGCGNEDNGGKINIGVVIGLVIVSVFVLICSCCCGCCILFSVLFCFITGWCCICHCNILGSSTVKNTRSGSSINTVEYERDPEIYSH